MVPVADGAASGAPPGSPRLLAEALALAVGSEDGQSAALHALNTWAAAACKLAPAAQLADVGMDAAAQEAMLPVLWHGFISSRRADNKSAAALLQSLVSLIGANDSLLLPRLLECAVENNGFKASVLVAEQLLQADPSLVLRVDSGMLPRLLQGSDNGNGSAVRRSKLLSMTLAAHALLVECPLDRSRGPANEPLTSAERRWVDIWAPFLAAALVSASARERTQLGLCHVAAIIELAPWAIPALLDAIASQGNTEEALNASLVVLRASGRHIEVVEDESIRDREESAEDAQARLRLPTSLLCACVEALSPETSLLAFTLVIDSGRSATPFSAADLRVVQAYFEASFSITLPAARMELRSQVLRFVARLRSSCYAAQRDQTTIERVPPIERTRAETARLRICVQTLQSANDFLQWLARRSSRAVYPGAPYYTCAIALSHLAVLIALDSTLREPTVPSDPQAFCFPLGLATPQLVRRLLSCADHSYTSVQAEGLALLRQLPRPLAGLESYAAAQAAILGKGQSLTLAAREGESAAAAALSCLFMDLYIKSPAAASAGPGMTAHDFVSQHLEALDEHVSAAEAGEDALLAAARERPLHGSLVTLRALFRSLGVESSDPGHLEQTRALYQRTVVVIDRIWTVTRVVLALSAPEGSQGPRRDHEAARALAVTGEQDDADDNDDAAGLGPTHQVLLSYAWRGMKEAAALLTLLVQLGVQGEAAASRVLWPQAELEAIGARYSEWMTLVRHRGAFSTIAPAYGQAASAILRCRSRAEIADLPRAWLDRFLAAVADPAAALSTTRRSAGIGATVVALLGAFPRSSDVVAQTVARLVALASESNATSPERSIHALNILRASVDDRELAPALQPHIGPLLELVVPRFSSPLWGIRNASTMLFSSLVIRALPGGATNRDDSASRRPFAEFFARFPTLQPALVQQLDALSSEQAQRDSTDGQSALFSVLLLLSRLQVDDAGPAAASAVSPAPLVPLVERCLTSRIWKLREIAARAYCSLTAPVRGLSVARALLSSCSRGDQNGAHGKLLAAERLVSLSSPDGTAEVEALSAALRAGEATWLQENRCAATQAAFLALCAAVTKVQGSRVSSSSALADQNARTLLQREGSAQDLTRADQAGIPALLAQCAQMRVAQASPTAVAQLLAHNSAEVRFAALDSLYAAGPSEAAGSDTTSALLACLLNPKEADWVSTAAARALARGPGLAALHGSELHDICDRMLDLLSTTPSMPLQAALLPVYAGAAAGLADRECSEAARHLDVCCRQVAAWSEAEQPLLLRFAALQALQALRGRLFPKAEQAMSDPLSSRLFAAHLACITLLTDDDEELRADAAELAGATIGANSASQAASELQDSVQVVHALAMRASVCSPASTDRAWDYMSSTSVGADAARWSAHVRSVLLRDDAALELDMAACFPTASALFAEEAANQYKQPQHDLLRCAREILRGRVPLADSKDDAAVLIERHSRILHRFADQLGLDSRSSLRPHSSAQVFLLATRLVLITQALALEHAQGSSAELTEAVELARRLTVRLDLELGALSTVDLAPGAAGSASPAAESSPKQRYRIAMISDFFFPNVGGVEGHMYALSQQLIARGHKVIVITHAYAPDRTGVRYLPSGLKVYHTPFEVIARQDTLPQFFGLFPQLRSILVRERIDIVHGHQALSSMAHEGILHARTMGLRAVFTDHSLFGFADAASILTNKLLRFVLSDVDGVCCVSHVGKENTTLRAALDPRKVYVIPNAVVPSQFQPEPAAASPDRLTIVVLSRLMYRKGIDLLIAAIPRICERHADVHFIIGGDGPKRVELEQMREKHLLHQRVELCGAIRQGDARDHLVRGQIFLNTSLTEAFGMSLIEAASAGLLVVSTRVGGVPEVLPPWMCLLAAPDEDDVVDATEQAIARVRAGQHEPWRYHAAVRDMYSWSDVAARTEQVYDAAMARPLPDSVERLSRYYAGGPVAGKVFCIIVAVDMLFLYLLEWLSPTASIDCVPDALDGESEAL